MKQIYRLTVHCESVDDLAAMICAVEREVENSPPAATVGLVAEQVCTFENGDFDDDDKTNT